MSVESVSQSERRNCRSQCYKNILYIRQFIVFLLMNCSLTIHRLVIEHCLPTSGGFASYVVHRIDEYLPIPAVLSQQLFTNACGLGMSEETLECLLHRTTPDWKYAVKAAVQGGHLHVLRWMTERKDRFGPWRQAFENVLDIAATHGHLDVVKWLCEKGVDYHELLEDGIDESTAEYIEKSWLYQHDVGSALTFAAEFGHLDVVQWIYNFCNGSTYSNSIYPVRTPINLAVERGHLDIAQWLYKTSGGSCSTESMDKAASLGDLEILQWLESNHLLKFTVVAMDGAARNGHLGVIKWLHETRTEGCSSRALHLAANNGHFEVVEWLYDNKPMNFDIPENTWINAALGGHLRVLRWLHDHFPETISTRTMEAAAKGGHLEVLMWLHELRNKEWINEKSFFQEMYPHCGQPRPRLEVVQWLHTHYPNKFITGLEAAEMGYIDIVRWLSDNSVEGFTTAMDRAAKHGHLDVVLYLMSHRSEGFSNQAMKKPADIEVHCLFGTNDDFHLSPHSNEVARDHLDMLQKLFKVKPSFVHGCLRSLAEIAVHTGKITILNWVNQFGRVELRSTAPIRHAVSQNQIRMLQWFSRNGLMVNEPDLLELAVKDVSIDSARWLWVHGYKITPKLTDIAEEYMETSLLRWLLDNGSPLRISLAYTLAVDCRCEEIMRWLPESDRVAIMVWAFHNDQVLNTREMIWWILTRTPFDDESSRQTIRNATQQRVPSKTLMWLKRNLANSTVCNWLFTAAENRSGSW